MAVVHVKPWPWTIFYLIVCVVLAIVVLEVVFQWLDLDGCIGSTWNNGDGSEGIR